MSSVIHSSKNDCSIPDQLGYVPLLFSNMIQGWEAANWTPSSLAALARNTKFNCRLHCRHCFQKSNSIQWEGDCNSVMSSVSEFLHWIEGRHDKNEKNNSLASYDPNIFWCYLDYKILDNIIEKKEVIRQAIDWSCFGLIEDEAFHNYVWLGTEGAHTPCHYDTYGFNLVVQIYGSKRWILFPPSDSENLYPTRIPYEESSVYSDVNIKNPDFIKHPRFKNSHPHVIILEPGQVLYIPSKWWHFVECLETSLSINTWLQLPEDKNSQVEEAITRMIFSKWMTFSPNTDHWLNPNENIESDETNAGYLSQTLYSLNKSTNDTEPEQPLGSSVDSKPKHFVDSKPKHLENFLARVAKILKNSPLQMIGLESKEISPGSNIEMKANRLKRSSTPEPMSKLDQEFVTGKSLKKQRLNNSCETFLNSDQHQSVVQKLSPCSMEKLFELLKWSNNQSKEVCPIHSKQRKSPEKLSNPGPLDIKFVEESLLRNLLQPDIVAILAKRMHEDYSQKLNFKNE